MPTMTQFRDQNPLLRVHSNPPAAVQLQPLPLVPSTSSAIVPKAPLPNVPSATRCTQVPAIYLTVEPPPISTYDDNSIFRCAWRGGVFGTLNRVPEKMAPARPGS